MEFVQNLNSTRYAVSGYTHTDSSGGVFPASRHTQFMRFDPFSITLSVNDAYSVQSMRSQLTLFNRIETNLPLVTYCGRVTFSICIDGISAIKSP